MNLPRRPHTKVGQGESSCSSPLRAGSRSRRTMLTNSIAVSFHGFTVGFRAMRTGTKKHFNISRRSKLRALLPPLPFRDATQVWNCRSVNAPDWSKFSLPTAQQ